MTPRSPNGGTRLTYNQSLRPEHIGALEQTQGSEPSQYLEEKKTKQ